MGKESAPDQNCGKCELFRITTIKGKPIGTVKVEPGKEIKKGVCGAEFGLVLGALTEDTKCMQRPVAFKPKKEANGNNPSNNPQMPCDARGIRTPD